MRALRVAGGGHSVWAPSKIICVAKNYAAHAAELNSEVPAQPTFFIKPNSSLADFSGPIAVPAGRGVLHHEIELAVIIGQRLHDPTQASLDAVAGFALALDLTLRELQTGLREQGYPWEAAKAFAGSCPVADFLPLEALPDPENQPIGFAVNGETRQDASTALMVYGIERLLHDATVMFGFEPGDMLLTGTPVGVGPLEPGDTYSGWIGEYRYDGTVGR